MKAIFTNLRAKFNSHSLEIPYFQIFYSASYIFLLLILLVLLLVTPAEFVYQIVFNKKLGNVFVVAATYIVTALIALFIYSSRLYTNRATLASIPRPYLPIEKDEVPKSVRRVVVQNRKRSALIAFESRPRHLALTSHDETVRSSESSPYDVDANNQSSLKQPPKKDLLLHISAASPPWGIIQHPGWSSPSNEHTPDLEFETVYKELPNLIEAKAVALASSRYDFEPDSGSTNLEIFQRPANMGLRDYFDKLGSSNISMPPSIVASFLKKYEAARFSAIAISETDFEDLMNSFSAVLSAMRYPPPDDVSSISSQSFSNSSGSRSILLRSVTSRSEPESLASPLVESSPVASSSMSMSSVIRHDLT